MHSLSRNIVPRSYTFTVIEVSHGICSTFDTAPRLFSLFASSNFQNLTSVDNHFVIFYNVLGGCLFSGVSRKTNSNKISGHYYSRSISISENSRRPFSVIFICLKFLLYLVFNQRVTICYYL